MSGDVQPRKRKDKKRKRDAFDRRSEGEVSFSRQSSVQDDDESSHGVHLTKMGNDDVHLHVHHEHGTGGHWCAKVLFFGLLAILLGLVSLIILENRGLSDLDTPLSESRFSNYFDGWVEEHRQEHEEHDAVESSIETHDDHDEPFEEEEDQQSDADDEADDEDQVDSKHDLEDEEDEEQEADNDDDNDNDDEDDGDDEDTNDDENDEGDDTVEKQSQEADDDDDDVDENATTEANGDDDIDNEDQDEDANDDDDDENNNNDNEDDDEKTVEETEENNEKAMKQVDDENDDNNEGDNDDNDQYGDNDDDDGDDNDDDDEDGNENNDDDDNIVPPSRQKQSIEENKSDGDPFDEEDDDDTFESVVDNDAEELLLLQQKARQQAAEAAKTVPVQPEADDTDDLVESTPSWASSLAVKIGVGLALALVARFVLLRKGPNANAEAPAEVVMKRRLTIATAEDTFPEDEDAPVLLPEDEYSEEEVEIEEEIEYVDEEHEDEDDDEDKDEDKPKVEDVDVDEREVRFGSKRYAPETFEQFNVMFKPYTEPVAERIVIAAFQEMGVENAAKKAADILKPLAEETTERAPTPKPVLSSKEPPKNVNLNESSYTKALGTSSAATPPVEKVNLNSPLGRGTTHEVTYDMDYLPGDEEDLDYDAEDLGGSEEGADDDDGADDDLEDDEDISDVDDTDLMNRLEMKYGRLPQREYESDEDPDDPTWTQIKPKDAISGGPQANDEMDLFEQELRKANEEMMRENFGAASEIFSWVALNYPEYPQAFLGKARAFDKLAEQKRSNKLLGQALEAFKRYLAFEELITNDAEYRWAAERCIERMRFLGIHIQAVSIHEQLVNRFSNEPGLRNSWAVTYLLMSRLSEAKMVLQETLRLWPEDGFALVHYGFVLKYLDKDYENAVVYMQRGIKTGAAGTQDGRFFFNLGDALQRLGRATEAREVYRHGAELKLFPSAYQRSLYNEPQLRAQPFWREEETSYTLHLYKLRQNWLSIRDEGLSLLNREGYFMDETENLRDTGDWKQFELYERGQRRESNCRKAPITCSLVSQFTAASGCRRGQVKFSVMQPGTHVWPHCGPTNCRLRAHLGLVVPAGTRLRVAEEEREWIEGKFLIFDDSFEHEVWHNGTSLRLVLIVDVWHPDLSELQRRSLTAI